MLRVIIISFLLISFSSCLTTIDIIIKEDNSAHVDYKLLYQINKDSLKEYKEFDLSDSEESQAITEQIDAKFLNSPWISNYHFSFDTTDIQFELSYDISKLDSLGNYLEPGDNNLMFEFYNYSDSLIITNPKGQGRKGTFSDLVDQLEYIIFIRFEREVDYVETKNPYVKIGDNSILMNFSMYDLDYSKIEHKIKIVYK